MANQAPSKYRKRSPQKWNQTLDKKGVRRSEVGKKRRTSVPLIADMIITLELPKEFEARNTKGPKGGGIDYQEFKLSITDHHDPARASYIKINSFLGEAAAGQKVLCRAKLGTETHRVKGEEGEFTVFYLKLESVQEGAEETHAVQVLRNRLAIDDAVEQLDAVVYKPEMDLGEHNDQVMVFDASVLNLNMDGAILVASAAALAAHGQ